MPEKTVVINIRNAPSGWRKNSKYVYIGRQPGEEHFGNPFSHLSHSAAAVKVMDRNTAVRCCRQWLEGNPKYAHIEPKRRQWILDNIESLRGKTLVCYCHPEACHGHVIAILLEGR